MKVGHVFGAQLVLNDFFLILLLGFGVLGLLPQALMLFAIVLVHELGHVVVARGYGLEIVSIELLPFGGVARVDDLLEVNPGVERAVALAGPLTNLFLVTLALTVRAYVQLPGNWLIFFIQTNAVLAAFNCLPALPLDGGRVLRSYLVRRMGFRRATERTADIGRAFGVVFGVVGAVGLYLRYINLSLIILAFFVFIAAGREKSNAVYVFTRYLARKNQEIRAKGVLQVEHLVAGESLPVKEVVKYFVPRRFHFIYVISKEGEMQGFVTEVEVVEALLGRSIETPLGELSLHRLP